MSAPRPPITVILPVLNGETLLPKCLDSIRAQAYPQKKVQLIVVDDDSSDGTVKLAKGYGAKVLRSGHRHIERSKAIGLRAAKTELLLFIDADNYLVGPDWLPTAVDALQSDKGIVAAQSARFQYQATDSAANRYCSLMGINDPMAYYLGKRDRLTAWEEDWTLLGQVLKDEGRWWKLRFSPEAVPTIGSQGFLTRRSLVRKASS